MLKLGDLGALKAEDKVTITTEEGVIMNMEKEETVTTEEALKRADL